MKFNLIIVIALIIGIMVVPLSADTDFWLPSDSGYGYWQGFGSGYAAMGSGKTITISSNGRSGRHMIYISPGDKMQLGYTYTITMEYTLNGTLNSLSLSDMLLRQLSGAPDTVLTGQNQDYFRALPTFSSDYISYSWERTLGSPNRCTLTIIVSTAGDDGASIIAVPYFAWGWTYTATWSGGASGVNLSINNIGFSAVADPDGDYYNRQLIANIAAGNAAAAEYYTDSLEKLDALRGDIAEIPDEIADMLEARDTAEEWHASTEGNSNVSSIMDSVGDIIPVDNIMGIIGQLDSYLEYSGTTSILMFPALSLPSFSGGEPIPLTDSRTVDLTAAVDEYIPSDYLLIIRSILSIMLCLCVVNECRMLVQWLITAERLPEEMWLDERIDHWSSQ